MVDLLSWNRKKTQHVFEKISVQNQFSGAYYIPLYTVYSIRSNGENTETFIAWASHATGNVY